MFIIHITGFFQSIEVICIGLFIGLKLFQGRSCSICKLIRTVVFLNVSVAQQLKRTGSGEGRPLLQQGDREETLKQLMAEREPLYRALADVIISAGGGNARKVARQIEAVLRERGLIPHHDGE